MDSIIKPLYSFDSKIRDKIKNEIGDNVIFIVLDGIPSYLEAGMRLFIGLCTYSNKTISIGKKIETKRITRRIIIVIVRL